MDSPSKLLTGPGKSVRDHRLDFWRGLCLIDMVLVHLVYQPGVQFQATLGQWLGEYTRFAAGGFVFVAGLSVGAIFLPRSRMPDKRLSTYRSLWRRSAMLMCVQYLAAIGFVYMQVLAGERANPAVGGLLWNILIFKEGGDLLLLYVFLIGMAPLLLEIHRRRFGWIALVVGSALVFAWADFHPQVLSFADGKFPPLLWQAVFVSGLLSGAVLPAYDRLAIGIKLTVCAAAWISFGILFWGDYWSMLGLPTLNLPLQFTKVPLMLGELLRYLTLVPAIITSTDLLWRWLAKNPAVNFTATLGRSSLPVYVLHVFMIELIGNACGKLPGMGTWQMLTAPLAVVALWGFALGWQRMTGKGRVSRPRQTHHTHQIVWDRPTGQFGAMSAD